jgi:hypothetical protein
MGDVIATSISSLVVYTGSAFATSNQASITSTQQLNISSINGQTFGGPIASTVIGLGTVGYLSTVVFGSIVSTANLANLVSTANLANLVSTANLANHISTANLANLISTANLANLISTANLANLVSTTNLANLVSTANLANLVSTIYLTNQLGSTIIGLGTAGYVSTSQLLSTSAGLAGSSGINQGQLTSTINSLTIPYSSLNTVTSFQFRASSTQLYYGTFGSTAQIYMGDLLAALN